MSDSFGGAMFGRAQSALEGMSETARQALVPTVRLGVTGLSTAGKTVFITALVHHLLQGSRLPLFSPSREGRFRGAMLAPQADDGVPTFDYRGHLRSLTQERDWPQSTRSISELRVTVAYERASFYGRWLGAGQLHIDVVDYPGEWLLDLPLLSKDFRSFSAETLERARSGGRAAIAAPFLSPLAATDPAQLYRDETAVQLADQFKAYLQAARGADYGYHHLPPGRFLMPGDLDGSPALTFAPLALAAEGQAPRDSLWAMMERRYEAYKTIVVKGFFRDHFARLDRQIVLVDVLQALNAGPAAMQDLELALSHVLACFKVGPAGLLGGLLGRKIDRILFAATKADHLHHTSHDRLERVLGRLVEQAIQRAQFAGSAVEVRAIASVRATREARVKDLPCIVGVPQAGQALDGERFDGVREVAYFPGDVPLMPDELFRSTATPLKFLKFRPPVQDVAANGVNLTLPHIRLDRALEFLLGDRMS